LPTRYAQERRGAGGGHDARVAGVGAPGATDRAGPVVVYPGVPGYAPIRAGAAFIPVGVAMAGRDGGTVTATIPCRCGAPIHVAGNPARGVAILRHADDPRALAFYGDDPLLARALAGDRGLLDEPAVRAWLGALHPAPGAPPAA